MWWIDPQHSYQLALLGVGATALLGALALKSDANLWLRRALAGLLAVVALTSVAAYLRFGEMHSYGAQGHHAYHYHDIYHYAVGAKYYPELGYTHLYECTWDGFQELRQDGVRTPTVGKVRNLAAPDSFFDPATRPDKVHEDCQQAFSPARWESFLHTEETFLQMPWSNGGWKTLLQDLGFNPPPSWSLIAHNLIRGVELTPERLEWLPFVDVAGIVLLGGGLVWWAFGWQALVAYLLVFGTNWMASYRWTGGSYLRHLWMIFLVCGICALQLRAYAWAGFALCMSVLMRVFPAVFVLGAAVALGREAWLHPEKRRDLAVFTAAGIGTAVVVVALTLLEFGPESWIAFKHKMDHHGDSWFMWHLGYKKWATLNHDAVAATGVKLARGWIWAPRPVMDALWEQGRVWHELVRISLSLFATWIASKRTPAEAALLLGSVLLYLWAMPANYYYIYLALLPAVFYRARNLYSGLRVGLVFATLASVSVAPYLYVQPYDQQGWWNRTVFWFLVVLVGTFAAELRWPETEVESEGETSTSTAIAESEGLS